MKEQRFEKVVTSDILIRPFGMIFVPLLSPFLVFIAFSINGTLLSIMTGVIIMFPVFEWIEYFGSREVYWRKI